MRSGSAPPAPKSRTAASTDICDVGADACEETDVRAEVVLSAGEADRGLDDAEAAEPDAEDRDWEARMRHSAGRRERSPSMWNWLTVGMPGWFCSGYA